MQKWYNNEIELAHDKKPYPMGSKAKEVEEAEIGVAHQGVM